MSTKLNKDRETTMDDVLEMISGFETGNFSNTLTVPEDSKLKQLVEKLNNAAKILAAQNAQNTQSAQSAAFIIDSLGIGIWKWDLISNSLEWDKNMYRLYGCDPNDFKGAYDAWESCLSAETKAKAVEEINVAIAGGPSFDTTFQVVQRNTGKIQEIRTRAFVILDDAGKPLKMWGINIDRTREAELEKEVKTTLKSLESASNFLEQVGELAKVGGWELDLKSGHVHMSRQTQILHEIDSNYVPPQYSTGGEWYPPEAWPTVQTAVQAAIEQGKPYDLESPFITAKGRKIWVRVQGYPLKEDGKVTALRGTFQDISERKNSEEEKSKVNLQLINSSKLASLGEMSAGIAHEVNNPLTIILAKAAKLIRKASDQTFDCESGVKDLKTIEATADRIAKIVKALRTYSREAENDPMEKQSLLAVIDDTFELCRERFMNANIGIQVQVDASITIRCRPAQISQVLMNLLSNSYDALAGLESRWVKIIASQKNGNVHIQFIDSGSALPETVAQKMMNPFFTTKEVGKGTGLGLSISMGIIKTHGGEFAYDPSASHTTFTIVLPDAQHFIKSEAA